MSIGQYLTFFWTPFLDFISFLILFKNITAFFPAPQPRSITLIGSSPSSSTISSIFLLIKSISLSIKALEVDEQKEAIANYGSADSGASLGDILGAALKESKKEGK